MRILVTGADGQLGQCIRDAAVDSVNEYIFTDVDDVDVTDRKAVDLCLKVNDFDVVINCAAYTDVERAEQQEEIAYEINCKAVGYLAEAAKAYDVTLIHFSTDYVFNGNVNQPIGEGSETNPLSAYGRTKLAGERAVIESGCRAIVIRTAWLYSEYGRNFVKTMERLSREKDSLRVVIDQIGSPTYARDIATAVIGIVDSGKFVGNYGTYNYSNLGVCSWYDLAKMTAEFAGNTSCRITPCSTSEYPSRVCRPSYSVLDKSRIMKTFGIEIPYWIDSLRECMDKLKTGEND